MGRLSTVGALIVATGLLIGVATPAAGQSEAPAPDERISIVQVSGLLDPVLVDLIEGAVTEGEREGLVAVILQVNSSGSVVSEAELTGLADRIRTADVPVSVWVGPSGARGLGDTAELLGVVDRLGVSPGSRIGDIGDPALDPDWYRPEFAALLDRLERSTIGAEEAQQLGIAVGPARVIGEFILGQPGVRSRVVTEDGERRRVPVTTPVFRKLPLVDQLMHTVASPAIAYLLFVVGMALILFELFTAGVGVAGLVGAGCFVLAAYGLETLPARGWAVALLVGSMVAFGVDVQTGVPRVWTGIGIVSYVVGTFLLYEDRTLSWITILVGIVGVLLFALTAMPAVVRARFSTPTIGRAWMVGELGDAVVDVAPEGVVRIRGALWRARTNRATPVAAGDRVRVAEVDGLLLEVEPEEGGARDYRERGSDRNTSETDSQSSGSSSPD